MSLNPYLFDHLIADLGQDWTVDYSDLSEHTAYDLCIESQTIYLNTHGLKADKAFASPYFRTQILLAYARALRMARHVEWLDGMLERYHPETILLIGRICIADTETHAIRLAFEAKIDNDDTSLWRQLLCGSVSDMAVSYENALENLLTKGIEEALATNKAMAIAFNQWFSCEERVGSCDYDTLGMIDGMIAANTRFQGKTMEKNAITCLTLTAGEDGSYIDSALQTDILKNPFYKSLNNPINQGYFMQIMQDMNKFKINGIVFSDPALAQRFQAIEDA
jgi:hypothetical protein